MLIFFANLTTIIGFGDSIYALSSQDYGIVFGDPSEVQGQVVKVKK